MSGASTRSRSQGGGAPPRRGRAASGRRGGGGARRRARAAGAAPARRRARRLATAQTIDSLFGPLPSTESSGRAWLYINNQLKPVRLRLGISDGTYTELVSGELEAGAEVVTAVTLPAQAAAGTPGRSPLMGPSRGPGGPPGGGPPTGAARRPGGH